MRYGRCDLAVGAGQPPCGQGASAWHDPIVACPDFHANRNYADGRRGLTCCPREQASRNGSAEAVVRALVITARHDTSFKAKLEHVPKRLKAILPIDLLAFLVRAPKITDPDFVDSKMALPRNLGGYFDFNAEIVRAQS